MASTATTSGALHPQLTGGPWLRNRGGAFTAGTRVGGRCRGRLLAPTVATSRLESQRSRKRESAKKRKGLSIRRLDMSERGGGGARQQESKKGQPSCATMVASPLGALHALLHEFYGPAILPNDRRRLIGTR